MNANELTDIEDNLFPFVRSFVREQPLFPWHRDQYKAITASQVVSSQALAVDFFGTIQKLASCDDIFAEWIHHFELDLAGPWKIELEALVPEGVLGEPRSTQIDVLAKSNTGLIAFECKFTEPDGGACSQPRAISKGAHEGLKQCDGNYAQQINPVNQVQSRCALTGKGIKYWDFVPKVLNIDPDRDYRPCPFSGGWYQWMRNLVAAYALGRADGNSSAFVVVYADGPFPMANKVKGDDWKQLVTAVTGCEVPLRAVSYQQLLALAREGATPADQRVLDDLRAWMARKVTAAAT